MSKSTKNPHEILSWADDDDGDFLVDGSPEGLMHYEGPVDENGIKIITDIVFRDGEKLKVTKRVKVVKRVSRVNIRAQERLKNWKKFGKAVNNDPSITVMDVNPTILDITGKTGKKSIVEKGIDREIERMMVPSQKTDEVFRARKAGDKKVNIVTPDERARPSNDNTYRPPSQRDGAREGGGGRTMGGGRDDAYTVRVTNLSDDIQEQDLRDLFGKFGPLQRVFLAKDKNTRVSKGFAFINFQNRADAERAIQKVSGMGHNHLILQVEWARK